MKKCPECGNPSYDGAPVCGNCGYTFPKPKVTAPKEDIFQQKPKTEKNSNSESTIDIIKENKRLIGIILIITAIVIVGIVVAGSGSKDSNSPLTTNGLNEYKEGNFAFQYPTDWKEINSTDEEHPGAKFFENNNKTVIEYYNVTTSVDSVKDITQQRISNAQNNGDYVELVETVTMDGRNTSNVILENTDGNYDRYVSMFSDGELYVFKISGDSMNSVNADDITSTLNSADIT